ncbi:MAG: hypothetical protein A2233_00840 [Candidatus Kerfeldbacteria bacterium RIFOXYA2_FULL_38_24]|uniref:Penicillin-binding protein 2 n=1 Tax=Candidatus Kerfeldbacteria bacterium RIFOXYB2_FULL_38_14 TaxID=1798547 RepID=A0A1G2BIH8_9BACT|nr:MAG: hypothetical protein A2233_00840 [Candidatus Kerfeldbacteria bacterium RIFOXYA2_FULL_38_24]OGY88100.1 MAG: hypothetical protein A2319_01570 [Candidatus Kerfeldbacteria bacterium RIFOXYB2_FULL_38_14]OGY88457.1 MAG: hypothetical protein A2458_02455 [Candidatus Kerfeldbacteria bacterium RIFOXYC2_FULL_38_9]
MNRVKVKNRTGYHHAQPARFNKIDRVHFILAGFIMVTIMIVLRLFSVQIIKHSFYVNAATDAHALVQELMPSRGDIYVQDKFSENGLAMIAGNQTKQSVYLNPMQISDASALADNISTILSLDPKIVLERAAKENDVYEPLKNNVSDQEISALTKIIEEKKLTGIHWSPEETRFYPEGMITSSITGFVGMVDDEKTGQYGLENYFNKELAGVAGAVTRNQDSLGKIMSAGDDPEEEAQDGDTLILTIDKNIQYKVCSLLAQAVDEHEAQQGSVIVMDPKTGAILSMCNAPLYDANKYYEVPDISIFSNDAIADQYEPGSVMKSIALATAIDQGVITPATTFDDAGAVHIDSFTIRNSDGKGHGTVNMTYVLEYSLNTGCIYALQQLHNNEIWYDYLQKFGFGQKTGIKLSGENPGDISAVGTLKDIYTATSCYGQGMTATPLQMLQAYGAIANGGTMMRPYIVKQKISASGQKENYEPEIAGHPISAETAQTVAAMLVRVVEGGHAIRAAVDGYHVAGKTGTAQIPNPNGRGYLSNEHKDTFVGFVSVSDPKAVILIKIDQPKDVAWSDASTAPLFSKITQFLVNYMQIAPDKVE